MDATCPQCHTPKTLQQKCSVQDSRDVMALQFDLFTRDEHKIDSIKIKQLPSSILKIYDISYKLQVVILHHGPGIRGNHFTAMVREDTKWLLLDNEKEIQTKWPRNNKDVYVLFYCKVVSSE